MTDPKNYMAAEDMDAIAEGRAYVERLSKLEPLEGMIASSKLVTHLAEYDRMRRKLDQITEGKSLMILSDEDRAKPIMDLSDEALVAWVRPTIAFLHGIQETRLAENGRGIDALLMMAGVIAGARMCVNANAGRMAYIVSGASDKEGELGDWQIVIEKHEGPPFEELVEELTADEGDSIAFNCENPMGDGPNNHAVDVSADWTGYEDKRFWGHTRYEALLAARNAQMNHQAQGDEG